MKNFDVMGFGALNLDKLFNVNRIVGKNDEGFVTDYQEYCGGSAANTIVGLTRLGLNTGFVGKVAGDKEGQRMLDALTREGVDVAGIAISQQGHSGLVMGFVDRDGERALYVAPGVNDMITFEEVDIDYVKHTKLLHLTSFVGQQPFLCQKELVERLSDNVKISLDPGVLYASRGLASLRPLIKRSYTILPNEAELKLLTGEEYETGAKILMEHGVQIVAVKRGREGSYVTNGQESYWVDPVKSRVVDTTGAGDAWNAGFLFGILKGKGLQESGKLGNLVASRSIASMGAWSGLPRFTDLT